MKRLLLFFILCITAISGNAQKEQTIIFGVNVGTKLANKSYAARYNGLYQDQLYQTINIPNNYYAIYQLLGDKDFYLPYDAYPTNMRYTPGILTGVMIGYVVSPNFQVSIDANFNKLKVRDRYTLVVYDASNQTSEPVIQLGELYAEESRFDGRFNMDYIADGSGKAKFIMGISGLFNAWRMDKHVAIFQGYQMPLFSVHNPGNNISNTVGDMGWGVGLNIGFEYRINEKMVSQVLYQPYQSKIDYGIYYTKRLLLQHDLVVRFLWR
jgi:hypothetical protein